MHLDENDYTSLKRYFRVDRREMVFLKFILEAYEGMSTLSTFDNRAGIVQLTVPLGFGDDMAGLIDALGRDIGLIELFPPLPTPEGATTNARHL